MGIPVVIVTAGGLPVTEATNGYGAPLTVATNGYGMPVMVVASGGLPVVGSGGGVVVVGGFASITIRDNTPIDPVSSIGASGSGWVADVVLKGLTSLVGTVVPTALTLSVTDPGYDASGNATTVARTITGVAHVRRQYPNGASKMISTDGTDLTILVSLDDWIYQATTIVSASISSTFYPACVASSAPTKTNSSTIAYTKPLFGWLNEQNDIARSSTFNVEAVTFHRHATAGRQVACIKFAANDGTTTSAEITVAATALSSLQTKGNIAEVWKATLDLSTLAAGTTPSVNINAKVYPWIGNSSAVLDLSVDGVAWPTSLPQTRLRVLNDRTGAYGTGYAYVQVGAGSGTVSTTAATARAAPYGTLIAAMTGLRTWNNANRAHNDLGGGIIRMMDTGGANTAHAISADPTNAPGATWCTVEADPLNTGIISLTFTVQTSFPNMMRYRNLGSCYATGGNYTFIGQGNARDMICLDNVTLHQPSAINHVTFYDIQYLRNVTFTGGEIAIMHLGNPATKGLALCCGVVGSSTAFSYPVSQACLLIGCFLPYASTTNFLAQQLPAVGDSGDGRIIYNNRGWSGQFIHDVAAFTYSRGVANVQNVYEVGAGTVSMNYFCDSDLATITNYIEQHNTAVGERASRMYNDVVATKVAPNGTIKVGVSIYNIWDNYNWKGDTFNANAAGSTGTWAYAYGVANRGNVSLFGTVNRANTDAPHNDNITNPYMGMAWLPSSEYNLFRTGLGFTQANIMDMFTSYTTAPRGAPAFGGNYIPLSTATYLKNRVPAGKSVLQFDLAGAVRKTDGTGAAGAYEAAP